MIKNSAVATLLNKGKNEELNTVNAFSIIAEFLNAKETSDFDFVDENGISSEEEQVEEAKKAINYLHEKYQLSDFQCMALAAIIDKGDTISVNDIGDYVHVGHIEMIKYEDEMKNLFKRGMVKAKVKEVNLVEQTCYCLTKEMKEAIANDKVFVAPKRSDLSLFEFFSCVDEIQTAHEDDDISYTDMESQLMELMRMNPNLPLVSKILAYQVGDKEYSLLLFFLNTYVNQGENHVFYHFIRDFYDSSLENRLCYQSLTDGTNPLMANKLIEACCDGGMFDTRKYQLTMKAKKEFLAGLGLKFRTQKEETDLIDAKSIAFKPLMFNKDEGEQMVTLAHLLEKKSFKKIQRRMEQEGMRTGFACLLYGAPGTGKTESVKQLARLTGRDIMQVDLSTIRDKYVGESEKNAKAIFDDYREAVSKSKQCPILLLNEADGLISRRSTSIGHHVDKMENTMQNIFLQEIEDLDGILIATTNLSTNLDSAFERRFIYKIEFKKPEPDVRAKIWKSMMPKLADEDASKLASKYEFTGGQIENIVRKQTINHVLYGEECNLDKLYEFCDSENNASFVKGNKRIGF